MSGSNGESLSPLVFMMASGGRKKPEGDDYLKELSEAEEAAKQEKSKPDDDDTGPKGNSPLSPAA